MACKDCRYCEKDHEWDDYGKDDYRDVFYCTLMKARRIEPDNECKFFMVFAIVCGVVLIGGILLMCLIHEGDYSPPEYRDEPYDGWDWFDDYDD